MVKCHRAAASDLSFYDIFAPQKVPFLKIFDDVIACDLWFGPLPLSKILATPMTSSLHTLIFGLLRKYVSLLLIKMFRTKK